MHAGAVTSSERELTVHTDQSSELDEILGRPWPAGRWSWTWSHEARGSLVRASSIKAAVDGLLADETEFDLDALDAELKGAEFARRLLPAQRTAVARLRAAAGGGNFSVPGSGKTTMTYAVYALLRAAGRVDRMLVISPQSAYEAWSEEARDCFAPGASPSIELAPVAPRRSTEVVVLNYERAAMGGVRAVIDGWAQGHRFLVVFDEAHRAKRGADGLHGQGALDLAGLADARLVLTGTPMPNGPNDLSAVLDLAWPGQGSRLASPHTPHADRSWVRITKDDLELEEAEVVLEPVRLDDAHFRIYEAVAEGLLSDPAALAAHPELAAKAILRLIACASNPMLMSDSAEANALHWPEELPIDSTVASLLDDLASASRPAKLLAAARHAADHANAGTNCSCGRTSSGMCVSWSVSSCHTELRWSPEQHRDLIPAHALTASVNYAASVRTRPAPFLSRPLRLSGKASAFTRSVKPSCTWTARSTQASTCRRWIARTALVCRRAPPPRLRCFLPWALSTNGSTLHFGRSWRQ